MADRSHAPRGNAALDAPASTYQRLRDGNHLATQSVAGQAPTRSEGDIISSRTNPMGRSRYVITEPEKPHFHLYGAGVATAVCWMIIPTLRVEMQPSTLQRPPTSDYV